MLWLIVGLAVGHPERDQGPLLFDRSPRWACSSACRCPTFVLGELLILFVFLPLNEHGFHWINTGYARSARASSPGWGT